MRGALGLSHKAGIRVYSTSLMKWNQISRLRLTHHRLNTYRRESKLQDSRTNNNNKIHKKCWIKIFPVGKEVAKSSELSGRWLMVSIGRVLDLSSLPVSGAVALQMVFISLCPHFMFAINAYPTSWASTRSLFQMYCF